MGVMAGCHILEFILLNKSALDRHAYELKDWILSWLVEKDEPLCPNHLHLIITPRLMTAQWRKLLGKICCLIFTVPIGSDIWSYSHFEPLIVGLYLPLSRHYPWNLRGAPFLDREEGLLRELSLSTPRWGAYSAGTSLPSEILGLHASKCGAALVTSP
jgi:hypothetical protein